MSSTDLHFPYISVFFGLKSGGRFYIVEVKNILLIKKIWNYTQSHNKVSVIRFLLSVPRLFQCGIKIRSTSCVFSVFIAVFSVSVIEIAGLCLIAFIHLAAFIDEIAKPVIALTIRAYRMEKGSPSILKGSVFTIWVKYAFYQKEMMSYYTENLEQMQRSS